MRVATFIKRQKKNIEMNHPRLLCYLLMIQRHSVKPICDWPLQKAISGDMNCYKRHMGYTFDINNPILFTEKIQWYKFFYENEEFSRVTDKYKFKGYIEEKLGKGYTIPLFGAWNNVEDIENDWQRLPEEFVIKANLQSDGRNIKIIHNKSEVNLKKFKRTLNAWLDRRNTLANSWDYNFYRSSPCILAEKYVDIPIIRTGLNLTNHYLCSYEEKQVQRKRDGSRSPTIGERCHCRCHL